jgi:hypothetical protein
LLLAYVGLYHKLENYENSILNHYNEFAKTNHKELKDIGIDFNKKKLFNDRDRIRLLCNSIKHNDCLPKKELLNYYPYLAIDKKLNISLLNFEADIELIVAYTYLFNNLISIRLLQIFHQSTQTDFPDSEEFRKDINSLFEELTKDESYKSPEFEKKYLKE